jgi:alkaline phosphatase D
VWEAINAHDPDLFLFIGDNNYADIKYEDGQRIMAPVTTRARFQEAYTMMADHAGFVHLRQHTPLMATWDDHDYGANDQGVEYPLKQVAQEEFWQAFGLAEGDPLWRQEGIYHSRVFGPAGRRVQVIMLDTRYFRDPLERAVERVNGPYRPTADRSTTVLGETQWRWLEEQLRRPADLRIIASSIQVLAYEHAWETWGNFPHERQRLFDLIGETGAGGVIFISGDRHLAEVSVERGSAGLRVPYPMWDFTSSGMTDDVQPVDEPNRFRVGPVYRGTNYGVLRVNWDQQPATVVFENRDEGGNLINRQAVALPSLRGE